MPPTRVHFNGSVNLADAGSVFDEITARVPRGLTRLPDGETGDRGNWIFFQLQRFTEASGLVADAGHRRPGDTYHRPPRLRLAEGVDPENLQWPDLGYARAYRHSYAGFRERRDAGRIPAGVRFQVQYPTPLASINQWIVPEQHVALEGSYERALLADLDRLLEVIPAGEIAVQWDVAVEIGILEGAFGAAGEHDFEAIAERIARCVRHVPADVPVGAHLCYGDLGHRHFTEPGSLRLQVGLLNAVAGRARRALEFVSFTVPQDRDDDGYFAPLESLATGSGTELAFGLVPYHPGRQRPGTTAAQVAAIDRRLPPGTGWAVGTECGMGRVPSEEIPALLDRHREILESYS